MLKARGRSEWVGRGRRNAASVRAQPPGPADARDVERPTHASVAAIGSMPVIRKLVAVVMADVVGYSRLMERDEAGTHQRLRALHDELIAPKIAEPDFTLSRFDAKRFSTHPVWIEEIRTRFIPGLRKAGVAE